MSFDASTFNTLGVSCLNLNCPECRKNTVYSAYRGLNDEQKETNLLGCNECGTHTEIPPACYDALFELSYEFDEVLAGKLSTYAFSKRIPIEVIDLLNGFIKNQTNWKCADCGSYSPPEVSACWRCGHENSQPVVQQCDSNEPELSEPAYTGPPPIVRLHNSFSSRLTRALMFSIVFSPAILLACWWFDLPLPLEWAGFDTHWYTLHVHFFAAALIATPFLFIAAHFRLPKFIYIMPSGIRVKQWSKTTHYELTDVIDVKGGAESKFITIIVKGNKKLTAEADIGDIVKLRRYFTIPDLWEMPNKKDSRKRKS